VSNSYSHIAVTVESDVFEITLDRPDVKNALHSGVFEEITTALDEAATHSEVRVIVITGAGEAFSAGGDIRKMRERIGEDGKEDLDYWLGGLYTDSPSHIEKILNITKPIVIKLNGDAVGAGSTLATIGDIVVASEDARIGDPHVGVGFVVPDNVAFWPEFSNLHQAKELLMTGKLVSADEAEDIGLVNHVVPSADLDDKVDEVVDELASVPQPALRFTKMMLNKRLKWWSQHIRTEARSLEVVTSQLADHDEFVDAFLNDREPDYPTARSSEDLTGA
jgi:enoyl-CoA hydratase